jgi:hypothetical protein
MLKYCKYMPLGVKQNEYTKYECAKSKPNVLKLVYPVALYILIKIEIIWMYIVVFVCTCYGRCQISIDVLHVSVHWPYYHRIFAPRGARQKHDDIIVFSLRVLWSKNTTRCWLCFIFVITTISYLILSKNAK